MELKPGYKQTEVGVIPEDWEVAPIGQAFDICNNLRLPISQALREKMAGPFPYYGPTGIQGYINEYRVEGEYALIGEDGDHFLKWRDQSMTLLVSGQFNVNNHAHLIRGSTRNLTAWFYYYFSHRDLTPYLTRQGAGRYKLTKNVLIGIPCALPTPPEQEAIAEALSDTDTLIESLEQLIAKKHQIKQGAMQELLTGKKRLPGFATKPGYTQTEVGVIPEDWEVRLLGQLGSWRGGATPSMQNPAFWANGTIPWVSSGDVKSVTMSDSPMKITDYAVRNSSTTVLPMDSIIIVVRSGILRKYLPVSRNTRPLAINQDIKALIPEDNLVPSYLLYLLTWSGPKILTTCLKSGTTVESIEFRWLKSFRIPLPPTKAEQTAIAAILTDMDAEIVVLEEKLAKARQIKQGMMQELLTGRIRLV